MQGRGEGKRTYILEGPLLLLVRLQDLEELLIRVRVPLVPLLDLAQVVDRVVELAVLRLVRLARVEAPEERGVVAPAWYGRL